MRKKKANIAPEFIGEPYFGGKEYWILDGCGTEPIARMRNVQTENMKELPISEFKDFVRLEPVSPLPREKRKYTRHEKTEGQASERTSAPLSFKTESRAENYEGNHSAPPIRCYQVAPEDTTRG